MQLQGNLFMLVDKEMMSCDIIKVKLEAYSLPDDFGGWGFIHGLLPKVNIWKRDIDAPIFPFVHSYKCVSDDIQDH